MVEKRGWVDRRRRRTSVPKPRKTTWSSVLLLDLFFCSRSGKVARFLLNLLLDFFFCSSCVLDQVRYFYLVIFWLGDDLFKDLVDPIVYKGVRERFVISFLSHNMFVIMGDFMFNVI